MLKVTYHIIQGPQKIQKGVGWIGPKSNESLACREEIDSTPPWVRARTLMERPDGDDAPPRPAPTPGKGIASGLKAIS